MPLRDSSCKIPLKKTIEIKKYKPDKKADIIIDDDEDDDECRLPMIKRKKGVKPKKCKKNDILGTMDPSMALSQNLEKILTKEETEMMCLDLMSDKDIGIPEENDPSTMTNSQYNNVVVCDANDEIQTPIPLCHNIVSTSQILSSIKEIDLQRLASLFPFTSYDRKRFAAITIRLANPHCTCLLFGSGKLVITGSTSFHACIVASQSITEMLREVNPRDTFEVASCVIQNIVAHVELKANQQINLEALYMKYCEYSTYQKTIFPGLVLRPPESPIVLLIFKSGRIVCTGGKSYNDIYHGFKDMFKVVRNYIVDA